MDFKKFVPHIIAVVAIVAAVFAFNYPVMQGKVLYQNDILLSQSASSEILDYRAKTGEEPLWTNSQFGGMPTFGMNTHYPNNWMGKIERASKNILPQPLGLLAMLMLGMYILLITLKIDWRLALIGAIGFGLSTYFITSYEAGHTGKLRATGYMAPVLAGVLLAYRGRWLLGAGIACFFAAMCAMANHPQITYYLAMMLGIVGIFLAIDAFRDGKAKQFVGTSLLMLLAAGIALGPNTSKLMSTYEYSKETIRGGSSELTRQGDEQSTDNKAPGGGLDIEYAYQWSYGIGETLTFLVADAWGGGSSTNIGDKSAIGEELKSMGIPKKSIEQVTAGMPTYWGDVPFTSGPAYVGAVIIFLFVLGLLIVDPKYRRWILAATIMSLVLALGRNFMILNESWFNYFPLYNKFRAPTMIHTIACLTMPLMAVLAVDKLLKTKDWNTMMPKVKLAFYITGGLAALLAVVGPSIFDMTREDDFAQLMRRIGNEDISKRLLGPLEDDRASLFRMSALKSTLLIGAAFGGIWALANNKLSKQLVLGVLGLVIVGDLFYEGTKYVNKENFIPEREWNAFFVPSAIDNEINKDPDEHYRVWNLTANPWTDARTSAQHKHLGGYSAVKLQRIQDLYERQLSRGNQRIFNMFNVKYILTLDQSKQPRISPNPAALGNAWFVNSVREVPDADAEMAALSEFDPSQEAIVDVRYKDKVTNANLNKSAGTIELVNYDPKHMQYQANVSGSDPQLAVFSEMYYEGSGKDWQVFIDNEEVEHFRVNYALRAMMVPPGEHTIDYKFVPATYYKGETYALIGSILVLLFFGLSIFLDSKGKGRNDTNGEINEGDTNSGNPELLDA